MMRMRAATDRVQPPSFRFWSINGRTIRLIGDANMVTGSALSMSGKVPRVSIRLFHLKSAKYIVEHPPVNLPVAGWAIFYPPMPSMCRLIRPYGLMKTPGEMGAAYSTHRRPFGRWKMTQHL